MSSVVAALDNKVQVLSVYLGDQVFGIKIMNVQDILRPLQMTSVPMAKNYIEGISNLRGRIVTAINLRKRIDNSDIKNVESMNVVIDNNGELYSILVDRVGDVLTLDESEIEDVPITIHAAWRDVSCGVHQLKEGVMILLDDDKIIHEE